MSRVQRICSRAVEFRATPDGDGRTLEGYAAVFRSPTRIDSHEGKFDEEIISGAFAKTLGERTPVLQFDHGRDVRTGSVPIGKINELKETRKGLWVSARLFDNPVVEPIRQAIEGGAIGGMSFRFRVTRDQWHDHEGMRVAEDELYTKMHGSDVPLKRTIREVDLFELGPVVFPAYASTSVGVRSILSELEDEDERLELLAELTEEAARQAYGKKSKSKKQPPWMAEDDDEDDEDDEDEKDPKKKAQQKKERPKGRAGKTDEGGPKKPYGDVTYADPGYQSDGKKRYPIDTKDHVKAAWSYINQSGNASKYSSSQVASIKSKIKAAAKKFGVAIGGSDDGEKKSTEIFLEEGSYTVGELLDIVREESPDAVLDTSGADAAEDSTSAYNERSAALRGVELGVFT